MINKLVLTGRMRAGKDTLCNKLNYKNISLAEPMYKIAEDVFQTRDKNVPGMREFLQNIGQWGWGHVDEDYPVTPERAILTYFIRQHGADLLRGSYLGTDFTQYGKDVLFWTKMGNQRAMNIMNSAGKSMVCISNARFEHEIKYLTKQGFQHYHIVCDDVSRDKRMEKSSLGRENDKSEQFSILLDREFDRSKCVWMDQEFDKPEGMLSFDEMKELVFAPDVVEEIAPEETTEKSGEVKDAVDALSDNDEVKTEFLYATPKTKKKHKVEKEEDGDV